MSPGHLPLDVDYRRLARDREQVAGTVPLERLGRLCEQLISTDQQIVVALDFSMRRHRPSVAGEVSVDVLLTCQRCMEPVSLHLTAVIDTLIVESEDALASLDPEEDGVVCEEKRISIAEIIEDDLMIDLPISPRHDTCAEADIENFRPPNGQDENDDAPDVHRPFAALGAMKAELQEKN